MVGDMRADAPLLAISAKPVWRIRIGREWPRYLLYLACVAGLAASARFAIDPPSQRQAFGKVSAYVPDLAAEGFASLFARRYLDWNSAEPQGHVLEIAQLGGRGTEPPTFGSRRAASSTCSGRR